MSKRYSDLRLLLFTISIVSSLGFVNPAWEVFRAPTSNVSAHSRTGNFSATDLQITLGSRKDYLVPERKPPILA